MQHMMGHSDVSQQRVTDDEKTDFILNFFPWPSHHGDQAPDRYAFACRDVTAINARRCQLASLAKVLASSGTISMCLNNVPTYTIMLVGRWSSDAFLRYIRQQVQEFTSGVSAKMIQTNSFFSVPHATDDHFTPHHADSRTPNCRQSTPNCRQSFATIHNNGRNAHLRTPTAAFALFT